MRVLGASLLLAGAMLLSAADWTNRAEYDLVLAIRSEAVVLKRLALLDQWKARYPGSQFRQERRELLLDAYSSLGDTGRMTEVVREMAGDRPDSPVGAHWCSVMVPGSSKESSELWSLCEKSWAAQKAPSKEALQRARRAAGWIHWQRGNLSKAETELTACFLDEPDNPEISAWLGVVLARQGNPEKTVLSLWHLARAGAAAGGMLETVYTSYHGGVDGVGDLRAAAAKSPAPPAGFSVESAAAAAERRLQEGFGGMPNSQPDAAFVDLRKRLQAADGAEYFAMSVRDKPLPKMKGKLTRFTAPGKPEQLTFGMENAAIEDLILKLSAPLPADPSAGQTLEFEGVAESFTASPFVLIVRAEPAKVSR